jgi:hypothetical protein
VLEAIVGTGGETVKRGELLPGGIASPGIAGPYSPADRNVGMLDESGAAVISVGPRIWDLGLRVESLVVCPLYTQ